MLTAYSFDRGGTYRSPRSGKKGNMSNNNSSKPVPIIDSVFPGRRVHLIGGASGSGKTTWLLQTLEDWRQGRDIHGKKSHPCPFVYLSYDRDRDDFNETCERLGIDPSTYRFISPSSKQIAGLTIEQMLEAVLTSHPDTRLIIVEGIAVMTPEGKINDQRIVGRWLRGLQEFCRDHDITIIGVLHSAKTKERDGYKEPRAKIAGCGAWAGYVSTVIILEEVTAESNDSRRTLWILPRNDKKQIVTLDMKGAGGRLVEVVKEKPAPQRIADWIESCSGEFTAAQVFQGANVHKTTGYAELEKLEKLGVILQVRHGSYKKVRPETVN